MSNKSQKKKSFEERRRLGKLDRLKKQIQLALCDPVIPIEERKEKKRSPGQELLFHWKLMFKSNVGETYVPYYSRDIAMFNKILEEIGGSVADVTKKIDAYFAWYSIDAYEPSIKHFRVKYNEIPLQGGELWIRNKE